jgi:hypothetical protein
MPAMSECLLSFDSSIIEATDHATYFSHKWTRNEFRGSVLQF